MENQNFLQISGLKKELRIRGEPDRGIKRTGFYSNEGRNLCLAWTIRLR